jgi:hypothetical protein
LRRTHPTLKSPPSIFETSADDVASLYSFNSGISETTFPFDRELITTEAYRRALAYNVQKKSSSEDASTDENVAEEGLREEDKSGFKYEEDAPLIIENSRPVNEAQKRMYLARFLPENPAELQQRAQNFEQDALRSYDPIEKVWDQLNLLSLGKPTFHSSICADLC